MVPEDSSPAGEVAERILEPCTLPLPLHRPRKRYVGVRQRPSGRWVAEIKDTTHKIRLWLGTFNNPEDAARAYDHAARTLRGANTRTNFASPAASRLSARLLDAGSLHAAAAVQPGVNQILPEQREVSNPHAALMRPGPEQPSSFSSFPGALLAFQPAASMGAQQMSGAGSGYLTPGASEQACVGDNKSSSDDVVHGLDHSWLGNGLDARHTVTTANQQTPVLEAIRAVADWGNLGQEADRMVWQHPAPPSQQPPMEAVASINWGDQFGSFSRPQQVPDLCAPNYLQPVAGNDSSYDGELMWGSSAAACEYVQSPCVFTHTTCDPTSQFLPSHSHSEHADIGLNFLLSSSPGPFCTDSLPPPIFCDGIHTHAPVSHSAHHAAAAAEYDTFNRGTEGAGPPVSTPSSISASFPLGSSLDLSSSGSRQSAADPDPSLDADETSPTSFAPTPCLLGSTSSPACARGLADLDGEEEATFNPTPLAAQHLILSGVIRDAQALLSTCDSSQAMPVC